MVELYIISLPFSPLPFLFPSLSTLPLEVVKGQTRDPNSLKAQYLENYLS